MVLVDFFLLPIGFFWYPFCEDLLETDSMVFASKKVKS